MKNVKPLLDKVLVKVREAETKTSSGIYIPDSAKEKTQMGTVIAIGTDKEIVVKQGDNVIYEKYAGHSVKLNDDGEYLLLKHTEILAVFEE